MTETTSIFLRQILPESFEYETEEFQLISESDGWFKATIRLKCRQEQELRHWCDEFGQKSKCDWRVRSTAPNAVNFLYRCDLVCKHNSHNKAKDRKNLVRNQDTNCQSKLALKIKLDTVNTRKRDNFVKRGFLSIVEITWTHNHSLICAEILSYRQISSDTKSKFEEYFKEGMSPLEALQHHRKQLEKCSDFTEALRLDSSIWPKKKAIYNLFEKWRNQTYGKQQGESGDGAMEQEFYAPMRQFLEPSTHCSDQVLMDITTASSPPSDDDHESIIADHVSVSQAPQKLEELKQALGDIMDKCTKYSNDPNVLLGISRFADRVKQLNSPSAVASFLFSCNSASSIRSRKRINKQPTAPSHRKVSQSRRVSGRYL